MPLDTIYVVAAIIKNEENAFLITQRLPEARYGGYWEFPGGTVGESAEEALIRELKEELNISVSTNELYWHESFESDTKIIDIKFITCTLVPEKQAIEKLEVSDYLWVQAENLVEFKFPEADESLIRHLTAKKL